MRGQPSSVSLRALCAVCSGRGLTTKLQVKLNRLIQTRVECSGRVYMELHVDITIRLKGNATEWFRGNGTEGFRRDKNGGRPGTATPKRTPSAGFRPIDSVTRLGLRLIACDKVLLLCR